MPANELSSWMQMLAFHGTVARLWERKKLRARLSGISAKAATYARQTVLHLASTAPEAGLLLIGLTRMAARSPPEAHPPTHPDYPQETHCSTVSGIEPANTTPPGQRDAV